MRVLITGATGHLGLYLLREFAARDYLVTAVARTQHVAQLGVAIHTVDICNDEQLSELFTSARPDLVMHTAAMSRVADAVADPGAAFAVNTQATRRIARLCTDHGARLIYTSTDTVFDGTQGTYHESSKPNPLNAYGQSKLEGEAAALETNNTVVARIPVMFGPHLRTRASHFDEIVARLKARQAVQLFCDERRSTCSFATAARMLRTVAESSCTGIYHLGGETPVSRYQLGTTIAEILGADPKLVERQHAPPRDLSFNVGKFQRAFPQYTLSSFRDEVQASL